MRKLTTTLLMAVALIACNTEKKLSKKAKQRTMERFDIDDFNKHKGEFNDQNFIDNNGQINRRVWIADKSQYYEFITNHSAYYSICKIFYSSGIIKEKGKMYEPGNFQIGIWEYFDSTGRLTRTEDFDKKYKISYKQALDTVRIYYGFHQRDLRIDLLWDGNWMLQNIQGTKKRMAATVNQKTGKHEKFMLVRMP